MQTKQRTVSRVEHKYLLDAKQAALLHGILSSGLYPDSHNRENGYAVRSLYFDTPDYDDYFDKAHGEYERQKIRLRIYDPYAETALLEQKAKRGDYQRKNSWQLPRAESLQLKCGDFGPLLVRHPNSASLFENGLLARRPVVLIEYLRTAFIWPMNNTRITLDRSIRFTKTNLDLFAPDPSYIPLTTTNEVVLEVKYNGSSLEPFIADMIAPFCGSRLSFGKYERCMLF